MSSRARWIGAILIGCLLGLVPGTAQSSTVLDAATIKAALRTATPEEGGFVDRVVNMAKNGQLPPQMVESTFQWARRKPFYRFQYFKRGMILRAARAGISL
ncbi:MAG: hypothetical protein ACUVUC_06055 [Thermoguttaceae bacterium]